MTSRSAAAWALVWILAGCGQETRPVTSSGAGPGATVGAGVGTTSSSGTGGGGAGTATGGATPGWADATPLAGGPRQEHAVVALENQVVVLGGFDELSLLPATAEAYDTDTGTWSSIAPVEEERHHLNAAVVDGKIYALGGLTGQAFQAVGDVRIYDPMLGTWSQGTSMPAGTERGGGAVGVIGKTIYVAGGFRNGAVADFTAYDTETDTWSILPDLLVARDHLVGGVVDDVFYVIGGRQGDIGSIDGRVDAYDPAEGAWALRESMLTERAGCAAATVGTRIYVFGGEGNAADASGVFPQVESYDTATDSWATEAAMPTPRHGMGAAAIDGVIYVPGGATTQLFGAVDTVDTFTP